MHTSPHITCAKVLDTIRLSGTSLDDTNKLSQDNQTPINEIERANHNHTKYQLSVKEAELPKLACPLGVLEFRHLPLLRFFLLLSVFLCPVSSLHGGSLVLVSSAIIYRICKVSLFLPSLLWVPRCLGLTLAVNFDVFTLSGLALSLANPFLFSVWSVETGILINTDY